MIKLFHVCFPARTLLLAASEGLISAGALFVAIGLWFGKDTDLAIRYDYGLARIFLAAFVCVLCMYYYDFYERLVLGSIREVAIRLAQVLGTVCVILGVIYYGYPSAQLGRGPLMLWILVGGCALLLWRCGYIAVSAKSPAGERAILLGDGPLAAELSREIGSRPEFGIEVEGYIAPPASNGAVAGIKRLGDTADLAEVVKKYGITSVITAMRDRRGQLPVSDLLRLKTQGIQIQDAPDVYEAVTGKMPVRYLQLSWLLYSEGFRISRWTMFYKRSASLVLSSLAIALTWPVMVILAIAIRLDSPGPAIFRQKRVGKDGKIFTLFKFRSMRNHVDPNRPAEPDDERITRIGRFIRRCRLDELPQLWNILLGDMSLIGPRPFTPAAEEVCVRQIPFYEQRWSVMPGLTGWAQVRNGYCATLEDNVEKLAHDLFYIKNISVGLDCLILFLTVKILLLGRGAR